MNKLPFTQSQLITSARGVFTGLCLFSLMLLGVYFEREQNARTVSLMASVAASTEAIEPELLEAKAAIVYDAVSGKVLYEKNADEPLPLASLTKLISADAILSLKRADSPVTISLSDLAPEGDSGLLVGDVWSLEGLLTLGLVSSSNDAMAAAAASAGTTSIVKRMNEAAAELGLSDMYFANPTGLDEDEMRAGAYGSARDMAKIASAFLKKYPSLFNTTVLPETHIEHVGGEVVAESTAFPILDIPGLLGAKTGYTDLAGGNLVAVFDLDIGHPVVAVVLGSSIEGRFMDVRKLIEATREAQ